MLAAALLAAALAAALSEPPGGPARAPPGVSARAPTPPLVDAAPLLPDALLDVRYATARNFVGRPLYPAARCLLLPRVAARLVRAAARLRRLGYRVVLHDCYRPLSVQRQLWAAMPRPGFVADPRTGSNHDRGAAVDCSLADAAGRPVELPTDYDAFDPRARAGAWRGVSAAAARHRDLLRRAMAAEGFAVNPAEWWHFDAPEAASAPLLDLPLAAAAPPGSSPPATAVPAPAPARPATAAPPSAP